MEKWYLLYCKRGQLDRAVEHLTRQHVTCMTPMTEMEKVVRGKRTVITEALFPNYLFVKFDHEQIHTTTIQSTRGVSHFIRFGALPAEVPEEIIELIQQTPVSHTQSPDLPSQGDSVVITEGIFAGVKAIFNEPNGESRSILLLNILNTTVAKVIDNTQFRKESE
ncbi:transcription/translation regulatory transformer protein RfaH [Providencia sp. PROV188]|jgi:transcriptional antiterminator RfaH|uniref:transcription/translation regulatory transformer protein RfaH n=1 Tax=Providencia TaxID=586 RepID=UPI0003E29C57|nr:MULTISPECIES: transcription/translation regulatory transformer protein RfaH [Providencia]ETS98948.1 transcription elongation factor/antiterminator RfaH [Providencia alcalifaciens PAL-3]EUC99290.1 transcription elongation factor/antiterminator RfaH [Providencia alcalifaciens PAL-1]MBG5884221.1 transcription/translation regulatory transformer protein RfaH [Providencia alcalifaciens]MBS0923643.1 transcription/translation regulatory transformer protein RfaH [Providencia sp. JGM181]MBS0934946.1 